MEITLWAVTFCDYDHSGPNPKRQLDAYTRLFTDEKEAREAYEGSKSFLVEMAGEPERQDGRFPGEKFVVETSEETEYHDRCGFDEKERTMFWVRRVTDRPEALYKGEVSLSRF